MARTWRKSWKAHSTFPRRDHLYLRSSATSVCSLTSTIPSLPLTGALLTCRCAPRRHREAGLPSLARTLPLTWERGEVALQSRCHRVAARRALCAVPEQSDYMRVRGKGHWEVLRSSRFRNEARTEPPHSICAARIRDSAMPSSTRSRRACGHGPLKSPTGQCKGASWAASRACHPCYSIYQQCTITLYAVV